MWECPDTSPDRQLMLAPPGKRKMTSTETSGKRVRESPGSEAVGSNAFSRGLSTPVISAGPSRRDTFRQRKPNTSRPPSMHVDDYVARERNIDGTSSGSYVISSSQRGGSTSGRPPSVHVDEFEARQRERQTPTFVTVGSTAQVKRPAHESHKAPDMSEKPRQFKADLDDDHEIDIVFDEESGSDEKLPFPQPDDNLQSASVLIGESSPGSVVEETEGNANEDTLASDSVDSCPKTAVERSGTQHDPLREVSMSSEKNRPLTSTNKMFFAQQYDEPMSVSPVSASKVPDVLPPGSLNALPSHLLNATSTPSIQHLPPINFHQRNSPQKSVNGSQGSGSQGYYDQKFPSNQPPLPPTPPPNISVTSSQTTESTHGNSPHYIQRDTQPPFFSGYPFQAFNVSGAMGLHVQSDNLSSTVNGPFVPLTNAQPMDNKYLWNTDSPGSRLHVENYTSGSSRPLPPLPPMPPPFSTPLAQSSSSSSGSLSSLHTQIISSGSQLSPLSASIYDSQSGTFSTSGPSLSPYSLPPFTPSLLISRPAVPGTLFSSPTQQHGQFQTSNSQSMPSPQLSVQSVQPQPPPPPPPQPSRPHPSQNLGFPIQMHQPQFEQVMPLQQNSVQVQMQSLQMQQQLQIPQIQLLYQSHQQEHLSQVPQPPLEQNQHKMETDNMNQQQDDPGMTLQQFFASPEAIQSLLSDRDKLCQLLEQHPKLMQMLQEQLGQH